MQKMNVILFGCKDTTLHVARFLSELCDRVTLVTISPEKGAEQEVAGYVNLVPYGSLFERIHTARRYDLKSDDDVSFLRSLTCDLGIAVGWQRLIPPNILELFSVGVFGMHGSAQDLPFGRGRSPMNWSIIEGRGWFYTNLFRYQAGVDDGPILDTDCFSINDSDTAESLHYKNTLSLIKLLRNNWPNFVRGELRLKQQKAGEGSYYPKRNPSDGLIDWSDTVFNIERMVRAVTRPFYGAFSYLESHEIRIYRASLFYTDLETHQFKDKLYGEICDVFPNGKFLVRGNGGVLLVHEFDSATKVAAPGQMLESPAGQLRAFPRNRHGFFDCS
jgi:UDP-4-amino-4-deoxy-L-arabinose formyltransferase/UDP-glucuronic acid dehydrogenase (UDP-4-keto-hexauronic acid decarboxylating)